MKKTSIKTIGDLKALGERIKSMNRFPYGFILTKEKWPNLEKIPPEILTRNKTETSPGSMGTFKEVKAINFSHLLKGKEGNSYILRKEEIHEALKDYMYVVKNLANYKPEDHPNIIALEDALTWDDHCVLMLTIYKNEEDMPV